MDTRNRKKDLHASDIALDPELLRSLLPPEPDEAQPPVPAQPLSMMELTQALYRAAAERNHPAAYRALKQMPEQIKGRQMPARCLNAALDCSPALFRAVLEQCAPGEYVSERQWRLEGREPSDQPRFVNLRGTILTLAAALNRTQHMKLLLERGWDVNGASYAQAEAQAFRSRSVARQGPVFNGLGSCYRDNVELRAACIGTCTPLAAALLCGSENAVRLLMEQPGIRTLEYGAVSLAAVVALHDASGKRQRCLRLVFPALDGTPDGDLAEALLCGCAVDLAAVAQAGTAREFALRLSGPPCTERQQRAAAAAITEDGTNDCAEKLQSLLERYPAWERDAWLRDRVLNRYLGETGNCAESKTLALWKRLSGERRDLSGAAGNWYRRVGRGAGCCTPMATAIACGCEQAARLLKRQPGVLLHGSSAVCHAAADALNRFGGMQRLCAKMAFSLESSLHDDRGMERELMACLDPATVAQHGSLSTFTLRLKSKPCTPRELRAAAALLTECRVRGGAKKLRRLRELYPEAQTSQNVQVIS